MLKPAEMRELRIITLDEDVDGVIKKIGTMGNFHLADIREFLEEGEGLIAPSEADALLLKSSDLLRRIEGIIALLQPSEAKKSIREILFKEREEVERVKVGEVGLEEIEAEFIEIEEVVLRLTEGKGRLSEELLKARRIYEGLKILDKIGVDLDFIGEGEFISVSAGKLPRGNVENLKNILESLTGGDNFVVSEDIPGEEEKFSFSVVVSLKKDKGEIEKALKMVEFEVWERPSDAPEKIREAIEWIKEKIKKLEGEIKEVEEQIDEIRENKYKRLLIMRELVQLEDSKLKIKNLLGRSLRVRLTVGWTPKEEVDTIVEGIRKVTGEFCIIEVREPKREDVRVPSLLKSPKIVKPFESVVKLYGYPLYKDINPTIITAILFPIIFGLMFPDIGHGLLLLLLGLVLLYIFKGLGNEMRDVGVIICLCGFCSMIAGAVFGEFFGFSEYASHLIEESLGMSIPGWLIFKPLGFEPIPKAQLMFVITMLMGTMHMGLGLFLRGFNSFSNRNLLEGVTVFVRIWCLFGALYFLLLLFGFHFTELKEGNVAVLRRNAAIFILLPIIVLMVLKIATEFRHDGENNVHSERKGKRSMLDLLIIFVDGVIDAVLENFFRFLANTVSYGRILALALCHAALMEVFILLSFMCLKMNIGVGALVFLAGTTLVVVLEALIAAIHTIRLHFYEWFTKFYEGGGVEFLPFKFSRTYTE